MTQALTEDPEPIWELDPHPHAGDVDWDLVGRLFASRTLIDVNRVAEMCGVNTRQSPWLWQRAGANYFVNGVNTWPPSTTVLRGIVKGDPKHPTQPLPHPSVLPPPDVPAASIRLARWYEGTIYRWGMKTRRITMTGEPLPRVGRPKRGRGPLPGRRLRSTTGERP